MMASIKFPSTTCRVPAQRHGAGVPTTSHKSAPLACGRPAAAAAQPSCVKCSSAPSDAGSSTSSSAASGSIPVTRRRDLLTGAAALGALLALQRPASAEGAVPKGAWVFWAAECMGRGGPTPRCSVPATAPHSWLFTEHPHPAPPHRPASAAYEDTALKLVAALREAISTDLSDAEERQVRRAADPAKSLVREFLTRWKGSPVVEGQESYRQLSAAIQQLGAFYQANGQRSRLSSEVGQAVLDTLDAAEAALPVREERASLLPFF